MAKKKRITPGKSWRVLAWADKRSRAVEVVNEGVFDELVVDRWIHLEQQDRRRWWMSVGGVTLWITVADDGTARNVDVYGPGDYDGPQPGCTYNLAWSADNDKED